MLSKKYRLARREINLIYKKGRSQNFNQIKVKFLDRPGQIFPRFALVVPQKVLKKAAARNRLRRVVFSEIEQILKNKKIQPRDYLIRFYAAPDEKTLRQIIQKVFRNV